MRSLLGLALLALAATSLPSLAQPGPPSEAEIDAAELADNLAAISALDAACADPASARCDQAKLAALAPISVAIMELGETGAHDTDAPRIRSFATADHPRLRWSTAMALGALHPTAADTETLLVLLNDPVPAVREAARAALAASEDPNAARIGGALSGIDDENWIAEGDPNPGVELPPGSTFLRFASDPETGALLYSSTTGQADLVASFARLSGRSGLRPNEFRDAYPAAFGTGSGGNPMERMAELGQRMSTMTFPEQMAAIAELRTLQEEMSRLTPEQVMAGLTPGEKLPATMALEPWLVASRFADPTIVVLAENDNGNTPTLFAVIYRDVLLGGAGFVLQPVPPAPAGASPVTAEPRTPPLAGADLLDELFWSTVVDGADSALYRELFPAGRHTAEAEAMIAANLPDAVAPDLTVLGLATAPLAEPAAPSKTPKLTR